MQILRVVFVLLAVSTAVNAEPVLYLCERPAWDAGKGCGPNNTYYTYAFYTDTEIIQSDIQADKDSFRYQLPEYVFAMRKGCDIERARPRLENFEATEGEISFNFAQMQSQSMRAYETAILDLESMTATLQKVTRSSVLKCNALVGESIIASKENMGDFWGALNSLSTPQTGVSRHQQPVR